MVRVTEELAISPEHVTLYYTTDPLLGHLPVLIFHGPSTTANYTLNSSRIQVHVYSPAGFMSFHRITISPNSPFYDVVDYLPREFQGDEICRGLAFGLYKYFSELPEAVKTYLKHQYPTRGPRAPDTAATLFSPQHAADLAQSAVPVENTADVIQTLEVALQTQHINNVDIDLVLPPGSIIPLDDEELEEVPEDEDDILDPTLRQYGGYTPLVKLFGEPVFLPTSKLRRAPSRPSSLRNRTKSFSRNQKVELRMKLGELVDTEERYVLKVNELVNHVADEFRQGAKARATGSISPSEEDLDKLFPPSADEILQLNTAFMHELRRIMDDTEEDAIRDMETPFPIHREGSVKVKDPSGALAMARLFMEWFPKFTECYQDYIRASREFPRLLNLFLEQQSSFRQRVAQKGEQAVRSLLIEPVQRLPRYSLMIDQIVNCLPITHPALQLMLRARDIITNICSLDEGAGDKPHIINRLRAMVECWPPDLEPQGRLAVAADFIELSPPFDELRESDLHENAGIFLVFSDIIVILKKKTDSGLTGRDLLREIDKPSPAGLLASMTNVAGGPGMWEFALTGWHNLADVRFTESADGRLIWMASTADMKGSHSGEYFGGKAITSRCFILQEMYEGRASKWSEEIAKARIEGRFSEQEREDPTWTLRSVRMEDNNFRLHAAVFQEAADQLIEGRREPAPIRVVLDMDLGTKSAPVGHYGVEVVVEISTADLRRISMNTLGLNGKKFSDEVALDDFLPTLSRRIIQLLSTQTCVANQRLAPALVHYYTKILRGLHMGSKDMEKGHKRSQSASPVKLLSNFLGGSTPSVTLTESTPSGSIRGHQRNPNGSAPALLPSQMARTNSRNELLLLAAQIKEQHSIKMGTAEDMRPENPLFRLEQTFTGFIANLQARKGYYHGRTLLTRSMADELLVNDLYNRLIEFPFDLEASAEVGTDIVFAAFEKFVRIAWRDQIGPIITMHALDALQVRASKRVVGDFGDFVRFIFRDLAPQNRRAFTALIKLLADLLDGCSNDGDRGALTLAFAELLVDDGTGSNYINLLDRLVEDCDRIFEDHSFAATLQLNSSHDDITASNRSQKSVTGSVTSNSSSLRRKFGFDSLLRQNSKTDSDRSSVWRSLSKHTRSPGESSSLSKASRSKSIDISVFFNPPTPNRSRRPGSRDRPPIAGAFDDITHRPSSTKRLETIGEPEDEEAFTESNRLKKKRRSSLSDLKSVLSSTTLVESVTSPPPVDDKESPLVIDVDSAAVPVPAQINRKQAPQKFHTAPRLPAPTKIPISPNSPTKISISPGSGYSVSSGAEFVPPLYSSRQKESPIVSPLASSPCTPPDKKAFSSSLPIRSRPKSLSVPQIPTLKPSRLPTAERPSPNSNSTSNGAADTGGNLTRSPSRPTLPYNNGGLKVPTSSSGRLGLRSPQKLRERLQTELKAVEEVDATLQSELTRISEDMTRINATLPRSASTEIRRLSSAVRALEERVPHAMLDLQERQAEINREMEATLRVAEAKVKAIDQLYKEATAENELLYEKFNSELGKMLKALKGKGREDKEELLAKLREQSEEAARVKKENARLKREMASLRALIKAGVSSTPVERVQGLDGVDGS
ncbi:hypothetical protein NEUTE1DRAFT_145042 [Neurospora tetrasperma FGSC 2508]|uniref:DH domain-containing protein n=1 Tax=Neurospora tetrasperma (strain FGSC 2508 / ATCC MYA-4615 / P0657) TaxID=510951 RepID=F8MI68_NEUT8|nr:uncharacterized protein NEUTE1DRAFT_145042 [Neurospora tetrasperma FGSC 2508]EGO58924.1 hypothetical protein NEUTE1DRAFT_145042 [Neurospora tetrasperma FGSC 2508]EGZ73024.1 hypothetical protein NEUTE2DRAFT_85711 [Neurospora tetrasperma FGSC 2509]